MDDDHAEAVAIVREMMAEMVAGRLKGEDASAMKLYITGVRQAYNVTDEYLDANHL